jgi:hypothetical protein
MHYFEFGVENIDPVEKTVSGMKTIYVVAESSHAAIRYMEQKIKYDHFVYRQAIPSNCLQNDIDVIIAAPYENYIIFYDERTGENWYQELSSDTPIDLEELTKKWIEEKFNGEVKLQPGKWDHGDITAMVKLNWTRPDSCHCWESGSFYYETGD